MLHLDQFDIKTGKPIQVSIEGQPQTALKPVENAYLEHWLATNEIEAQLSVARFYESVNDADRRRLESEGKHLVFTSGSDGYFTDRATAQLMTLGSETVTPIYTGDRNSPHNMVAYGGLISSDGVASTSLSSARLLVIDDERVIDDEYRKHGATPLVDRNGQPVSPEQLAALYDKMGDGTMLVSDRTMRALQTPEEREQIAVKTAEKNKLSGDITTLAQELEQIDATAINSEQQEIALARRTVVQFRAASPDLPGIAKGTMMASSYWCDRLGVDAIISANDIKGADQRLLSPGIKEVSNFWINRKAQAQYGEQSVGPQVKYTIPEATQAEFNPRIQQQAEEFVQVAGEFNALSQHYMEQKEREQARPSNSLDDEAVQTQRSDWLYEVLSADKYGQLTGQAQVVRGLSRYARGEWRRLAESGISVPSAMAQHHSQLKPWEVCNKDLPHGAIVAYYRSPFPNVGAAAIAINNTAIIQERDREAFSKDGVAYLSPWTAKNIAITDFDGDRNGFFVGHTATVPDLPEQLREQLASINSLPLGQQYEAGRALLSDMMRQCEAGQESRLTPADYPQAVQEFAARNAPEVKPPQINKQTKEKHPWQEGEAHTAATWRAWKVTADNPVGMVANAGMTLQALALEMKYASPEVRETLVRQHSAHFEKLLSKVKAGEVSIPSDDWLSEQGFSPFYEERIGDIAGVGKKLDYCQDPQRCNGISETYSQYIATLFSEVANGPNALNLQTAVDMAKSSRGIDRELHRFVTALQYKRDAFRQNKDNPQVYGPDYQPMPTSMEEPVSWNVQAVNASYSQAQLGLKLEERPHEQFRNVLPGRAPKSLEDSLKQTRIDYDQLVRTAMRNKARVRQSNAADQQPTMLVRATSGREFALQEIRDEKGSLPIWRAEGKQQPWTIMVTRDTQTKSDRKRFPAQLTFLDSQGNKRVKDIGFVSPESAQKHELEERLTRAGFLSATAPEVTLRVPFVQQNDTDMLYAQAERCLQTALEPPPGQDPEAHRQAIFTEFWGSHYTGHKIVMLHGTDVLCDRLSRAPEITVGQLKISSEVAQRAIERSPHTIQFGEDFFPSKGGEVLPSVSVLKPNGDRFLIGAVAGRNIALPEGATYMAAFFKNPSSEKVIDIQIMELPAVAQTQAEVAAFSDGRSHLTFDYEPYTAYGIREGQVIIAQAEGNQLVALRVGDQHRIDARLAAQSGAAQRWADVEKTSPSALFEQLAAAHGEGKELWGLNVEPLGTYAKGQITPLPEAEQQHVTIQAVKEPASVTQSSLATKPASLQLYERYSDQNSGVLAAVAAGNPQLQQRLDSAVVERAIADGQSVEAVQDAIAQHSPEAQRSGQPDAYAKNVVGQVTGGAVKAVDPPSQKRAQAQSRNPPKRTKAKDSGMGY